jgi:DNA-binding MarR family transcriptional regulator
MAGILTISMLVKFQGGGYVPLKTFPGHLGRRFHQVSTVLFDLAMRDAGISLTPVQYAALVVVRDNPEIDQATLAGLIAYDRTTIGGVVDRLVEKGYISRSTSSQDRRSKLLTVSEEGTKIIEAAGPYVQQAQERLVESLDADEIQQLTSLMEKVVDALGDLSRSSR